MQYMQIHSRPPRFSQIPCRHPNATPPQLPQHKPSGHKSSLNSIAVNWILHTHITHRHTHTRKDRQSWERRRWNFAHLFASKPAAPNMRHRHSHHSTSPPQLEIRISMRVCAKRTPVPKLFGWLEFCLQSENCFAGCHYNATLARAHKPCSFKRQ